VIETFPLRTGVGQPHRDLNSFRHVGTTPFERWYAGGSPGRSDIPAAVAFPIDTLRCAPFIVARPTRIDRIGFQVTVVGGAGSVARCGIYRATSRISIYPGTLIVDGGEKDCAAAGGIGVKSTVIDKWLDPGILYWFVYNAGVSAPTSAAVLLNGSGIMPAVAGMAAGTLTDTSATLAVASAYAALPATFPAGAAFGTGSTASVAVRLAL